MMTELGNSFEYFYSRVGFNEAADHFDVVGQLVEGISERVNLADLVNELLDEKVLRQPQIPPILSALLVGKFGYHTVSINLSENYEFQRTLLDQVGSWKGIDLVVGYNHPELGIILINPKREEHWRSAGVLRKHELVTIYSGSFDIELKDPKLAAVGATAMLKLLVGGRPSVPAELKSSSLARKRSSAVSAVRRSGRDESKEHSAREDVDPASESGSEEGALEQGASKARVISNKITPMYGVPVQNELFHNGNVEAWKKIIQSYETKYPWLQVCVYYDGEKINDIHTLFKWGKVKHGSTILFAIRGEGPKDISKLNRYLKQGASHSFEIFLKFPVNKILNLF